MKGYIYKYTFPNGKVYIGQTRVEPEKRHKQHIQEAKARGHNNSKLNEALNHFVDNYKFEIIEELEAENLDMLLELLDATEFLYIRQYDSIKNGYNSKEGGGHRMCRHVKTKDDKILETIQWNVFIDECQERRIDVESYDAVDVWDEVSDYFEELSQEEKQELINKWWEYNCIVGIDDDGNIIGKFHDVKEIGETLGVGGNTVRNALNGKQKKAYGYTWKYGREILLENNDSDDGETITPNCK